MPRSRASVAAVCVVLIHVLVLIALVTLRRAPVERVVAARPVSVLLLSAAPHPVTKPAALQSKRPAPQPTVRPPVRETPPPRPKMPPAPPVAAESAPPAPASAPAPAAPLAPPMPAIAHPTLAMDAPKSVAHLECNIAKPDYPYQSQRRGESGTAVVKFVVGLTGGIENVALKRSSGFPRLDDAALDAMRNSTCLPYKENGEAVRAAYSQPFAFNLDD